MPAQNWMNPIYGQYVELSVKLYHEGQIRRLTARLPLVKTMAKRDRLCKQIRRHQAQLLAYTLAK